MITALFAHPYPRFSIVSYPLLMGLKNQFPKMDARMLYDLYPDGAINVAAEREAVSRSSLLLVLHPVFWYSVPALLKQWFDTVLGYGFAYGEGAPTLRDKAVLWMPSIGSGFHGRGFQGPVVISEVQAPIKRMWESCGAAWLEPQIIDSRIPMTSGDFASVLDSVADRMAEWEAEHD
ncbi:NAD(P)H-dependent oxidoreductase [Mesosutterella sp. OilRF-GAM-744-9]|uniref:NAD(P)H-dependent oxidoreductase n=1 Tax=Mesosutterella porci TaxID=2915351 RepID=A0ABS9MRY7_9BURK|nr:NAD(P)H-dependent oxidoreductase [Mesosutterella sp. oilRF-744-WT-GAM-9]MCG5031386.1 NAD(P)H-dependent oxidoreductase [Mesosutterella sp. oilRF-744-WT-GAM-9]